MCLKVCAVLNLKSFITTNLYDIDIRQINTIFEVYKNKGNNHRNYSKLRLSRTVR